MKTTLNKIRERSPCASGWTKLLKYLGKTCADDVEVPLLTILESNGLDDALWCLRAVDGCDKEKRLMAVAFAREVQHLMKDHRSIDAIDVAERFAHGEATTEELKASYAASASYTASDADAAYAYASASASYAAYAASASYAASDAAAYAANDAAAYAANAAYASASDDAASYADADASDAMKDKQIEIFKKFMI